MFRTNVGLAVFLVLICCALPMLAQQTPSTNGVVPKILESDRNGRLI